MVPPPPPAELPIAKGGDGDAAAAPPTAFSIEAAQAELAELAVREQELDLELEKLYNRAAHLCQSESRSLAYAGEQHKQVPEAIRKLQETLQQTSGVADELSSRVRKLDVVCGRVTEALTLVDEMLELRECSEQVMKAIASEDYEQAAKYVARYRASQDALPPGTDEASIRVLREAEQQMNAVVRRRFEAAMEASDSAGVSRFAKLFHPLGLAGEGVQKYVEFIRRSLAEKCATDFRLLAPSLTKKRSADGSEGPYATALTNMCLTIADIVQEHQESVEQEFGPQNFIVVVRGLVEESDAQGIRVIDRFSKDNAKIFDQQVTDMHQAGMVLEETALMTQRAQQFDTYIRGVAKGVVSMVPDKAALKASLPEGHSEEDGLAPLTKLVHRVQELVASYVCVEQTFLLRSVEKAITENDSLDPEDSEQLTTTLVDDAFAILLLSMQRALTTCDINAVCAVVNNVGSAVSGEIRTALVSNLNEGRKNYENWVSYDKNLVVPPRGQHPLASLFVDQEGKLRSGLSAASSWPHSLNNLQQCLEYLDKLKETVQDDFNHYFPDTGPDKDKRVMFSHCIGALDASKAELENLHSNQCKQGFNMLKVHLTRKLEPLKTLDYNINEAQYADCQVNDPFAKAFNIQADIIHQHIKAVLNPASCEEIMQQMADQTCRRIESDAKSKRFSLFGALQFDSDVRAISSFFTTVSEQALRHKFTRLFEMSSLLNLEGVDELRELYGEMRTWRLSADEIRKLVESRVDFDATKADLDVLLPT